MSTEEKIVVNLPGLRLNKIIPQRKLEYAKKLRELLDIYSKCMLVSIDNVGSRQIADMRRDFRGKARFLFGKNTLIRKVLRDYVKQTRKKEIMNLMENIRGNIGFVFTHEDVVALRKEITSRKRQSAAKVGTLAPVDVFVPEGPTGMEPTQTGMFQSMDIPTRINRGQIDITSEVHLIKKGEKVGASHAALLSQLGIKPFYYGMLVVKIFENGEVYDASVLDITSDMVAASFYQSLASVAALCFQMNTPTIVNVPHSLLHAYKKVLALGLSFEETGYSWPQLKTVREVLANPGLFAATATGGGGNGGGAAAAEPEKEPTPEPESSAAPVGGMFGDSDSSDDSSDEDSD